MQKAAIPINEQARLRAVEEVELFGTPPEPQFDDLALIASRICQTPVALVTLIDDSDQWFKAHVGIDMCGTSREEALCSHTILGDSLLVVPDALLDRRFRRNPFVTGAPHIRFYAGMPLIDPRGNALGTLCVIDVKPKPGGLDREQAEALAALGRQVAALMELRRIAAANARLLASSQASAAQLEHQATHDALTGLPNRALFSTRVDQAVCQARFIDARYSCVLFIDLDGFKLINDSLGHAAGDQLLREVAARLSSELRTEPRRDPVSPWADACDVVARLGGDEFTVLLQDVDSLVNARRIADRLLASVLRPFDLDGREVRVGCSIGIAWIDGRHDTADDALREADTAMYHAKLAGKGRHVVFDSEMQCAALARLELDNDLRAMLASEDDAQLRLYYQPVVSLVSGKTVGFEALVRWQHPERGLILPNQFIPLAEESDAIVKLGERVIDEACRQLAAWSAQDPRLANLSLNVNVSRRQLIDPQLIPHLHAALTRSGIDPSRLKLEITESAIMRDPAVAADAMRRLRALGVELYMDDFGTGHSSLSCLHRFPLDGLKIDRSFVSTMTERRDYAAIVHAVMDLAHNFKMRVTAEGIETIEQVQLLQMLDCELGQGYYFAKPMTAVDAARQVLDTEPLLGRRRYEPRADTLAA